MANRNDFSHHFYSESSDNSMARGFPAVQTEQSALECTYKNQDEGEHLQGKPLSSNARRHCSTVDGSDSVQLEPLACAFAV